MNCELVSDITFAGGQPATEAEAQVRAAAGFTVLAFCKGPLVCGPLVGRRVLRTAGHRLGFGLRHEKFTCI
jgi:hypothetical protein